MSSNPNIPVYTNGVPTNYVCEIPVVYTEEDNFTYIKRTTIDIVECVNIPLPDSEDFWNCHLCGSDEPYSQPVLDTDVINLQFRINTNGVNNYQIYLFDGNSEIIEDSSGIQSEVFSDGFTNKYLNIRITPANIPSDCFHFRIYEFEEAFDEEDLSECIAEKISLGRGPKEAELLCRIELQPDHTIRYSELYRKTNDTCEDTIWLEAEYPSYDCNRNYYGVAQLGNNNYFTSFGIRVPGTLEKSEMTFEDTIVFNTKRTSKQSDTYTLRTQKLPPYVVEQLAVIFQAKSFEVDGVSYKMATKRLTKNFEEGRMWIINTTLVRDCDIDFLCS